MFVLRNKQKCIVFLTLFFTLLLVSSAGAVKLKSGSIVNIPAGTIKGPVFLAGSNVIVDADVQGDVFIAGETIFINGKVTGDVLAAGSSVNINGIVDGDIRAAANIVDLAGSASGSINLAGNAVTIKPSARIGRDVLLFANSANVLGTVEGQVLGNASQMNLNGVINDDVVLWGVDNLTIGPDAVLGGTTTYRSENEAQVDATAQVGPLTKLAPSVAAGTLEPYIGWPFVLGLFLSGIVLWVVYYLIFPTRRPQSGQPSSDKFLPTLGKGFLTLLAAPLAILLLFITLIGIPLGMLLLVICIVILCLSKIIVGDYIGRLAFKKFGWQGNWTFFAAFVVALLFLKAVTSIPMVGFFISLIIASTAMGLVIAWLIRYRQGSLTPPASLTRLSNIL